MTSCKSTLRILGVDPGSRWTGYGCIEQSQGAIQHVTHGALCVFQEKSGELLSLEKRLLKIHQGLSEIITQYQPDVLVVEQIFLAKNVVSALKLGHARGAVLLTGKIHNLAFFEYSPTQVKQILVGHGRADKAQVAKSVLLALGQQTFSTWDASDGLALALCHAYYQRNNRYLSTEVPLEKLLTRKKKISLADAVGASQKSLARKERRSS